MTSLNSDSQEALAIIKEEFQQADTDGSGFLTQGEVKALFQKKMSIPLRYLHKAGFKMADGNKDGKIDFDEYVVLRKKFAGVSITEPTTSSNENKDSKQDEEKKVYSVEDMTKLLTGDLKSDDAGTVEKAAKELSTMLNTAESSKNFAALGAHTQLVSLMKKWNDNQDVLGKICWCMDSFTNMYGKCDDCDPEVYSLIVSMGGMDALIAALHKFPTVHLIQDCCMCSIGNILFKSDDNDHKERVATFVKDNNGVPIICNAMSAFPNRKNVQKAGIWLLNSLRGGGMDDKVETMETVCRVGCGALDFSENQDIKRWARNFTAHALKEHLKKVKNN